MLYNLKNIPLSLPTVRAIAAGEFFNLRVITKLAVTRRPPSPAARNFHRMMARIEKERFAFGPYKINPSEVFYTTKLSYAMVNLRPVLPDLTADETTDLWLVAKEVGGKLEHHHKVSSLTFTIQDGPQAGQTVPHVHIHIIPRKSGDFEKNDEIYDTIDMKAQKLKEKLDLDIDRKDRTLEEMSREADEYRLLFT